MAVTERRVDCVGDPEEKHRAYLEVEKSLHLKSLDAVFKVFSKKYSIFFDREIGQKHSKMSLQAVS